MRIQRPRSAENVGAPDCPIEPGRRTGASPPWRSPAVPSMTSRGRQPYRPVQYSQADAGTRRSSSTRPPGRCRRTATRPTPSAVSARPSPNPISPPHRSSASGARGARRGCRRLRAAGSPSRRGSGLRRSRCWPGRVAERDRRDDRRIGRDQVRCSRVAAPSSPPAAAKRAIAAGSRSSRSRRGRGMRAPCGP